MTRNTVTYAVCIGNGLYAMAKRTESAFEYYRRIRKTCEHTQRDPNGTCYRCGHRMPYESAPGERN
jgi:hypothetical protein